MQKKKVRDVKEENPSRFINHRDPLFQAGNTRPEVCGSR